MIDGFEPLSYVLWAVVALAAGMYPLGFMLGGSCSPCCGTCEDVFEFDRCVRFVNTDTSPPPTTYAAGQTVSQPLHGFSVPIKRPEDIGARRVGTKASLTASILLDETEPASLRSMSDGETQSATFRYHYRRGSSSGADLGTAKQWNVTLVGVTRPLTVPASVSGLQYLVGPFAANPYPIREYGVGELSDSTSAPVSASVHSVAIRSGAQFIDGASVTDSTLKAMLTATIQLRNGVYWVTRLEFAATADPFQYVPVNSSVSLEYVIKHSRGSQHRFCSFTVSVFKTGGAFVAPLPPGGLTPPSLPQPSYADTPYAPTSPTYSETDPDAVTLYSSDSAGVKTLKTVEVIPTGEQLNNSIYVTAQNSQNVLSYTFTRTNTEFGYIMRPFDPGGGYAFNSAQHPAANAWIYDTALVWSFLNGEATVPCIIAGTAFTVQISEPTQFCGVRLCGYVLGGAGQYGTDVLSTAVASTITVSLPKQPQTVSGQQNRCYGDDPRPVVSMRRRGCEYSGTYTTCANALTAVGYSTNFDDGSWGHGRGSPAGWSPRLDARTIYCGDLLWAIENGPCRESLTIAGQGVESTEYSTVYSVEGADSDPSTNFWQCAVYGAVDQNGKCPPLEVSVTLTEELYVSTNPNLFGNFTTYGMLAPGDYVLQLVSGAGVYRTNCNNQVFGLAFPLQAVTDPALYPSSPQWPSVYMIFFRRRRSWCEPWDGMWPFLEINASSGEYQLIQQPCLTSHAVLNPNPCQGCYPLVWRNGGCAFEFPMGSADFGEETDPYSISVSASPDVIPRQGGIVTLTYCCPPRVEQRQVLANDSVHDRVVMLESLQGLASGAGATAYITQAGYDGEECPFDVIWLSGSTGFPEFNWSVGLPGRIFSSQRCPIKGQVSHTEQPGCDWSVSSSDSWVVAKKSDDGLVGISIDWDQPATYSGSLAGYGKPYRSAIITIKSEGTSKQWGIIEIQF